MSSPKRVLIVDDSALLRKALVDHLSTDPRIEVVGTAPNGKIAFERIEALRPDVVTLDLDMPVMNGIQVLEAMLDRPDPIPAIMFSSHTREGAELTFRSLEAGAMDYIEKPTGAAGGMTEAARDLAEKIVAVAGRRPRRGRNISGARYPPVPGARPWHKVNYEPGTFIGIGISTGGPAALAEIIGSFDEAAPPTAVVQHMPAGFVPAFAARLDKMTSAEVRVAENGMPVGRGRCVIAPGDRHLEILRGVDGYRVLLRDGEKVSGHRPSADVLFHSLALASGARALGVVMTGMGRDGADGALRVREMGGAVIAQDEESSVVYGMPKAAAQKGAAHRIASLDRIPATIQELVEVRSRQ